MKTRLFHFSPEVCLEQNVFDRAGSRIALVFRDGSVARVADTHDTAKSASAVFEHYCEYFKAFPNEINELKKD